MGVDDGFDALEGRYGNMIEMGIIDPLRVCRSALQNGASVAGLLLTTNTLVAEEQTPVGRQPGADDRVRRARRGPAPALARLQHAAVARPRPVGRLTRAPVVPGGGPGRVRRRAAPAELTQGRGPAHCAAALARPAAQAWSRCSGRRSSPPSPTSTPATSRRTSRPARSSATRWSGSIVLANLMAMLVQYLSAKLGRRHRAGPARALPRAPPAARSRAGCGCRPSWSPWPPTWPSSSAPPSG